MSVILGNPTFVPPKEDNKEAIDVIVGVFFDGTSNNRSNIEGRRKFPNLKNSSMSNRDGSGKSFGNDNSNVDKLQKAYTDEKHYYSIYVEGMGTKNPDDPEDKSTYYGDFTRGQGFGTGETGLLEKVEKGCFDLVKKLKDAEKDQVSTLYIDVYGFSRGAAAARIFVNELYKTKDPDNEDSYDKGLFGKAIEKKGYEKPPIRIRIRFLGLYDTVLSYTSSKVDLTIPSVGFVAHLTAENEHRMNFPLTNIASASNGIELTLPGVHSDIGGGYKNGESENVILTESRRYVKIELQNMLEQGWFKKDQLKEHSYYLEGIRPHVSNEFSLVILHLMAELGVQKYKIPWKYEKVLNLEYSIPSKIDDVKVRVYNYAFKNAPRLKFYTNKEIETMRKKVWANDVERENFNLKVADHNMLIILRNEYLHCSASMDGIGMEPRKQENEIDPNWNREILAG